MAGHQVTPSSAAAAAFLRSRAGEFAGSPEEQTTLLIRATQEIAFRSGAYQASALLLGVLAGLGSGTQEVEVELPAFQSSRLQRHLSPSRSQHRPDGMIFSYRTGSGFLLPRVLALVSRETRRARCADPPVSPQ